MTNFDIKIAIFSSATGAAFGFSLAAFISLAMRMWEQALLLKLRKRSSPTPEGETI